MEGRFERMGSMWMEWSKMTFKNATALSSINKMKNELTELELEIKKGDNVNALLLEYADVILCILHSAKCEGLSIEQITKAMRDKILINMSRKWKLNDDGETYSHIKTNICH